MQIDTGTSQVYYFGATFPLQRHIFLITLCQRTMHILGPAAYYCVLSLIHQATYIFLETRALFTVVCISYSYSTTDNTSTSVRPIVAFIAHPHKRSWLYKTITNDTPTIACTTDFKIDVHSTVTLRNYWP